MTGNVTPRRRKPPAERRSEIIAAAAEIALNEGLQCVTLRRVAEMAGVMPGLVNYYFPAAETLAAAAFAAMAEAERTAVFARAPQSASVVQRLSVPLRLLCSEESAAMSLLWLDAWQASRTSLALRAEVERQMAAWEIKLAALISEGVAAGQFHTEDETLAAIRIWALIDGMSVQAALPHRASYQVVQELVMANAERELGLPPGSL